jgi:hypothetical protein
MNIPKVKYSDKILNSLSWFMSIGGLTLWPYIILREKYRDNKLYTKKVIITINHESIHIKQQQELLVLPFYLWYFIEWFLKLFIYGKRSYYEISFEREAYNNQDNLNYLKTRKWYSFLKYL